MKRGWALLFLLLATAGVRAQSSAGLPAPEDVMNALRDSPLLQKESEAIEQGVQRERKRRAGPHEWQIAATQQQRTEASGARFDEQEYGLQRGLRWPWKASVDRRLGTQERLVGALIYSDAWHEAGRSLLDMWFEWFGAERSVSIAEAQLQSLRQQQRSVERRVEAGDAAAVELQLADAETQRMQSARNLAALAAMHAREALAREFPGLPLVLPAEPEDPAALPGTDAQWMEHITADNHELELAQSQATAARLAAERASLDRLADPTLALNYSDNLDGNRRLLGLTVSVPIGGTARSADAAIARSQSRAAEANVRLITDRVQSDARAAIAASHLSLRNWQDLTEASAKMRRAADAAARGYELGELDLAVTLSARRQALEAEQQLMMAHLTALHDHARVLLDSHRLWALPEGHEPVDP
ncbi:MAG: TolC family protein [Gammaproteobacteria bacterium]|nr:TolC family protein [Gammaproteobacteria bacterium]